MYSEEVILHPTVQYEEHDTYQKIYEDSKIQIYLGSAAARRYIEKEEFQWVIEIGDDSADQYSTIICSNNPSVYRFNFLDHRNIPLMEFINPINECLITLSGKGLIHCREGRSRSVAVAIYFIMKRLNLCYTDAYDYVKSKRPVAKPNVGFQRILRNITY